MSGGMVCKVYTGVVSTSSVCLTWHVPGEFTPLSVSNVYLSMCPPYIRPFRVTSWTPKVDSSAHVVILIIQLDYHD